MLSQTVQPNLNAFALSPQVERNDRKWIVLSVFLLTVSVGLLTTVAYKLDQVCLRGAGK